MAELVILATCIALAAAILALILWVDSREERAFERWYNDPRRVWNTPEDGPR